MRNLSSAVLLLCLLLAAIGHAAEPNAPKPPQPLVATRLWACSAAIPGRAADPNARLSTDIDYVDGHIWLLAWDGDKGQWLLDLDLARMESEAVKLPPELTSAQNKTCRQGPYVLGDRVIIYGDRVGWYDLVTQQWSVAKKVPWVIGRPAVLGRRLYFPIQQPGHQGPSWMPTYDSLASSAPDFTDLRVVALPARLSEQGTWIGCGIATRQQTLDVFAALRRPDEVTEHGIFAEYLPQTSTWRFRNPDEWQRFGMNAPARTPLPMPRIHNVDSRAELHLLRLPDGSDVVRVPAVFEAPPDAPEAIRGLAADFNLPAGNEVVDVVPDGWLVISPSGVCLIPKETVLAHCPDAYDNVRWEAPHRLSLK